MGRPVILKKHILLLIIAAAALALCCAAALSFAYAEDVTYHETESEAAAELRSHMVNRETEVTIGLQCETDQEGLQKMIGSLVDEALEHTGNQVEGDYIRFQYASYKGMGHTGLYCGIPIVEIKYELSYYDDADMEAETDKKVSEIVESLQLEGKTKYEKKKRSMTICAKTSNMRQLKTIVT